MKRFTLVVLALLAFCIGPATPVFAAPPPPADSTHPIALPCSTTVQPRSLMTTMGTFNTLGQQKGTLRVTLRVDQTAGISLGGGRDLMPGETDTLPYGLAVDLINTGRASLAVEPVPALPPQPLSPDPVEIQTPEGNREDPSIQDPPVSPAPDPVPTVNRPAPKPRKK